MNLRQDSRLDTIWVAIGVRGEWKDKFLGKLSGREVERQIHAYGERCGKGVETRWPPTPAFKIHRTGEVVPCRFELLNVPQLVMP